MEDLDASKDWKHFIDVGPPQVKTENPQKTQTFLKPFWECFIKEENIDLDTFEWCLSKTKSSLVKYVDTVA